MFRMDFTASERATLGIEWELALVDRASGDLAGRASEVIDAIGEPRCVGEFLTNTVELVTEVHRNVPGAIADLRALRNKFAAASDPIGVAAIGSGTHPFADWHVQTLMPADRYLRVVDRARDWGRQLSIWGLHVHVGIPDPEAVMPVMRAVLANLPWLLAVSASSPFWGGVDTQFASHRTMLFQQLPTGGIPPTMRDWADFERTTDAMIRSGTILDVKELRWDVRPASRFGTIEVRIADGAPSLFDVGAGAALTQCIVEEALRALDRGEEPMSLTEWAVQENKFRAARWGFDTNFIVDADGREEPARASLARRVDELLGIARDLGCEGELVSNLVIVDSTSADRQRAAMRTGSAVGVVDTLRAEFLR
jgi:carboxylate-amine ligase